ncbi:MAG TPA: hypothetical protein ACYCC0_00395 [Candidatus Azoamicus sp.]
MTKTIIIILLTFFLTSINAKNYNDKTDYFIAKKLFYSKSYSKSEFILKKIILENNYNNKYSNKAKILKALIEYKKNEIENAKNTLNTIYKSDKKYSYYKKILYLKAILYYNSNNNFFQKKFKINKNKNEQELKYKALLALKKIKNNENNNNKIKNYIKTIKEEINQYKINVCEFYIKRKAYISVIRRLENKDFILKVKNVHDYYTTYLILKSYNELLLDNISKKILNKVKKYDKIQASSN